MNINSLMESYIQWSRNKISFNELGDSIEIVTPFVDMFHDHISLYIINQNNHYIISDDGYIIDELDTLGFSPTSTPKRKSFFNQTLNTFGVKHNTTTNELYIEFNDLSRYPEVQQRLIQCVLKVSDMLMTSQQRVKNYFTEDISEYFLDESVPFTTNSSFLGRTGNLVNFDFVIGQTRTSPATLIKAINNPTGDAYIEPLFHIDDVRKMRTNHRFFIIANDMNKEISDKFQSSANGWDVPVLPWSQKSDWVRQLKA